MTTANELGKQLQTPVSLQVAPTHKEVPTLIGAARSKQAGIVFSGYYSMDYLLPGGDRLRILANHDKNLPQLLLISNDPQKFLALPGNRPASMIANTISIVNRYLTRSDHYKKPRTQAQIEKYKIASASIKSLCELLAEERAISPLDWHEQEKLRGKALAIIEQCQNANYQLANHPLVSEGMLGEFLYDACKAIHHYEFNRQHQVTRLDQLDFSTHEQPGKKPALVWDSELHIPHDEQALEDCLRTICQLYGLIPAEKLSGVIANRFERLEGFFLRCWQYCRSWIDNLASPDKPYHEVTTHNRGHGLSTTAISPYYVLRGLNQKGFQYVRQMAAAYSSSDYPGSTANSISEGQASLALQPNGAWVDVVSESQILVRLEDQLMSLRYFRKDDLIYPLPHGDDLYTLMQLSKYHLYVHQRIVLGLKAFFSRIPLFFKYVYYSLYHFVADELYSDFSDYVHDTPAQKITEQHESSTSLHAILKGYGLLPNRQTLQEFVEQHIANNNYVIIREQHPQSPPAYTNPLHRTLGVVRHFFGFFVETSERNPIIGTLAMAAYIYGAGAIIAPQTLTVILTKLHLKGLIYGIKPTQIFGQWMSHGTASEAISAATTYWQGIVVGGDLDQFFIKAVEVLRENPAEVAIIIALALSLGYGLSEAIPSIKREMGKFPYINQLALGGKGGAAAYDTIMHPGEDWLLGTIKWVLKSALIVGKLLFVPFIRFYYYGFRDGFLTGWQKSGRLFIDTMKHLIAAIIDLALETATIPFTEGVTMALRVPFRGITSFASKTAGALGNIKALGEALLNYAMRPSLWHNLPGFRLSPLYGFNNPIDNYHPNRLINYMVNGLMIIVKPVVQCFKNFILLPLIDTLSFSFRLVFTLLNPVLIILFYSTGLLITGLGIITDNTVGILLRHTATAVTHCSNLIDTYAGLLKQVLLEQITIFRKMLYHWAFAKEDKKRHYVNSDEDYFLSKPIRLEQFPHSESHGCLLNHFLSKKNEDEEVVSENFPPLFQPPSPKELTRMESTFSLQARI